MPRVNDLTIKQRLFLKYYLDPESESFGNGTASALRSYDTNDDKVASVIAAENLVKLRKPVQMLMEKKGIGIGKLLTVLSEGLDSTRTISVISGKQAKGTDTDFVEVPDFATRHRYLETAGKWLELEKDISQTIVNIQQNNLEVSDEDMQEFLNWRKDRLKNSLKEEE